MDRSEGAGIPIDRAEMNPNVLCRDDVTADTGTEVHRRHQLEGQDRLDRSSISCHTAVVDGNTVKGHVPMQAIETMLEGQPDIARLALPGMPADSPGMGGGERAVAVCAEGAALVVWVRGLVPGLRRSSSIAWGVGRSAV